MIFPWEQGDQTNNLISTAQSTFWKEIEGSNGSPVADKPAFIGTEQLAFEWIHNFHNSQEPVFKKADTTCSIPQTHPIRRILLVICQTNKLLNHPPILAQISTSNKLFDNSNQNIRSLTENAPLGETISSTESDSFSDLTNQITNLEKSTAAIVRNEENNFKSGGENLIFNTNTIPSGPLFRKLVRQLGDTIVVDKNSSCGYSVIYPNHHVMDNKPEADCAMPTCSVGTQQTEESDSPDDYSVALEFAKNHGYGQVEFVDATGYPQLFTRKKAQGNSAPKHGFMCTPCHHDMESGPFSIKYRSKVNIITNRTHRRFCPSNNCAEMHGRSDEKPDFDVVKKISEDIARIDFDFNEVGEKRSFSKYKKRKMSRKACRTLINKKYGRLTVSNSLSKSCLLNTNEMGEGNPEIEEQNYNHGLEKEGDDPIHNSITFSDGNEWGKTTKPTSTAGNINDPTGSRTPGKSNTLEGNKPCDLQKGDTAINEDGREAEDDDDNDDDKDDNGDVIIRRPRATQSLALKAFRKLNPFKSKIFKKGLKSQIPVMESTSLKVEEVQITRFRYHPVQSGSGMYQPVSPGRNQVDEKKMAIKLHRKATRQKMAKKSDNEVFNPSGCRPKPMSLKNSYVNRVFQMYGDGKRFFSCTNLAKDNAEDKPKASLEECQDITSGDFTNRFSEPQSKKREVSSSTTQANAHGDVVADLTSKTEPSSMPHCIDDQTVSVNSSPNAYRYNQLNGVSANVERIEKDGLDINESGKNNNKSETAAVTNPSNETSVGGAQLDYPSSSESGSCDSKEDVDNSDLSCSRTPSAIRYTNTGILDTPCSILFEEKESNEVKMIQTRDDIDLMGSNCNNNAKESDHDLNRSQSQTSTKTDVAKSEIDQNPQSPINLRSDSAVHSDSKHFEWQLDNQLKCLVNEQYAGNDDTTVACGSNALGLSSNSDTSPYFNQNSSKTIQRVSKRAPGRYGTSSESTQRSYAVSSPREPEVDTPELFDTDHLPNETDRHQSKDFAEEACGEDEMTPGRQDGFPTINMHQRHMVYCPTTENYWAQERSHPILHLDTGQTDSQYRQDFPGSCEDSAMHVEGANDDCHKQEPDSTMAFYTLIGSRISESENKLSERLENLYGSVNKRLSSLEALVKKRFDKTQSLIGNLKKQNNVKYRDNIAEESGRNSRAIYLTTEATRSMNAAEMVSVKNLDSKSQSDTADTFPSIAFTEVTPINSYAQPPSSLQRSDDGAMFSKQCSSKSENSVEKLKQCARHERNCAEKRRVSSNSYRKENKSNPIGNRKLNRKSREMQLFERTSFPHFSYSPPSYQQRQHSRKCRLRNRRTGESSCSLCMIPPRPRGSYIRKSKVVKRDKVDRHRLKSKPQHSCRSKQPRGTRSTRRTKGPHRTSRKRPRKKTKKRQRKKESRTKTISWRKHLNKSNSSVVIDSCRLNQHRPLGPEDKPDAEIQNKASYLLNGKTRNRADLQFYVMTRENKKRMPMKSYPKLPSEKLKNALHVTGVYNEHGKRLKQYDDQHKGLWRGSSLLTERKKSNARKVVGWSKKLTRKDSRKRQPSRTRAARIRQKILSRKRNKRIPKIMTMRIKVNKRKTARSNLPSTENAFERRCTKNTKSRSLGNRLAPRKYLKKQKRLIKKVANRKRYSSQRYKNVTVIKREVEDEFSKLLSTCSHQRAYNLHSILCPWERNLQMRSLTPKIGHTMQPDFRALNYEEENNNKSLFASNTDMFNRIPRLCNSRQIPGKKSFVRTGALRHVDSLNLIRKDLGCKKHSKNPRVVCVSSFKPTPTQCRVCANPTTKIVLSDRPGCSGGISGSGNVGPRFNLKQFHDERTKTNHKLICYKSKDLCELVSSRSGSGLIGVVRWGNSVENDTTNDANTPPADQQIKTKNSCLSTNASCSEMASLASTSSKSAVRQVCPGNESRQPGYSWSKPTCVDVLKLNKLDDDEVSRQSENDPVEDTIPSVSEIHIPNFSLSKSNPTKYVLGQKDETMRHTNFTKEAINNYLRRSPTTYSISSTLSSKEKLDHCSKENESFLVDLEQDENSTREVMPNENVKNTRTSGDSDFDAPSTTWCHAKYPTLVLRLGPTQSSDVKVTGMGHPKAPVESVVESPQGHSIANDADSSNSEDRSTGNREGEINGPQASSETIGKENKPSPVTMCHSTNQNSFQPIPTFDARPAPPGQQPSHATCHANVMLVGSGDDKVTGSDDITNVDTDCKAEDVNGGCKSCTITENVGGSPDQVLRSSNESQLLNKTKQNTFLFDQHSIRQTEQQLPDRLKSVRFCDSSTDNRPMASVNNNKSIDGRSISGMSPSSPSNGFDESRRLHVHMTDCLDKGTPCSKESSQSYKMNDSGNDDDDDDDDSKTKCMPTRQPYLEIRTPGLSTRWTISPRWLTDNRTALDASTYNISRVGPDPSNTDRDGSAAGETMADSTNSKNSSKEVSNRWRFEGDSSVSGMENSGFSSDPGQPTSSPSETNNNNMAHNSANRFPFGKEAISVGANDEKLRSNRICRFLPYDKYNCRCCASPVKSMTTLHSLTGASPWRLSEALEGTSQNLKCVSLNEESGNGALVNPRKRSMSTDSDVDWQPSSPKYRKAGSLSQAKRSKIHFRRARWQLMRGMRLSKLGNVSKRQRLPTRLDLKPSTPDQTHSSDADSESSL